MIDIHSHILYGIDDGCKNVEESIQQLRIAEDDGITDIICTPHYIHNGLYHLGYEDTEVLFNKFKQEINDLNINVNLHLGNEIFIHPEIDVLIKNKVCHTLANTNCVLIEFPMDFYRDEYDEYLYNVALLGYQVIVAHPERYHYVQENYKFCERWIKEGYYIQINQNSISDKRCARITKKILKERFVNFIASDAHDKTRPSVLKSSLIKYNDKLKHVPIL